MPTDLPPDYKPKPMPDPANPGAVPDPGAVAPPSGGDSRDPGVSEHPGPGAGAPGPGADGGDVVDPSPGWVPARRRPQAAQVADCRRSKTLTASSRAPKANPEPASLLAARQSDTHRF